MKPFTEVLRLIRRGRAEEIATEKLAEVVSAVDATGNPGKLVIELTIKPEKGGGNQKTITCKVTAKKPMEDIPEAIFFSDAEGDLHRTDPNQREMFVDAPNVRDIKPHDIPGGMAKA